ncbi:uncharacterized protein LOC130014158 [Patella vulgata]|uniref:uncharacterized protein LOC130014158 n=1 Tax=Patella vulgata TaxID=6465 RepID=UPI0024A8F17E|nr:uncharacterized protein LOC130014158 [Patella vulgata]
MVGTLVYTTVTFFLEYLEFNFVTKTSIRYHPELEFPAVTFCNLFSHLGGYMGFCIGASVLTLIELVEVVLKSLKTIRLYRHCTEKNREETPTNPV